MQIVEADLSGNAKPLRKIHANLKLLLEEIIETRLKNQIKKAPKE
ncbi:hypothetical protein PPE04_15750 [Pediococcus pentosaceus]|nr:hypothetical protein PPE04_15750 [Pediococcus pentosaceus]